ncbi:MAG TPA: hypothetical protein VMZ27_08235, partial [Candidatus Saccharimonadales bacterium]|nr:hypothetical protein [Candidatus Saccharimonadales bacterium]
MDSRKNPLFLLIAALFWVGTVWAAPLKTEHRIHDRGHSALYEIATDEVQSLAQVDPEKIAPQADPEAVRQQARSLGRSTGLEYELVLYPKGVARTKFNRRILTKDVLVHLEPGADPGLLAVAVGARFKRSFDFLPNHFFISTTETGEALALAEYLRSQPGVISAEPQLASFRQKKLLPNDTYFAQQWHLRNIGQNGATPGMDINVTNVWNTYRGSNIVIGIVDDGLQYTHPDLAANYLASLSYDFNFSDPDPAP